VSAFQTLRAAGVLRESGADFAGECPACGSRVTASALGLRDDPVPVCSGGCEAAAMLAVLADDGEAVKRTDLAAAGRLIRRHGRGLRYVAGQWLAFDGIRWAPGDGAAQEAAKDTARSVIEQEARGEDPREAGKAARFAAAPRIRAALDLAASDPLVARTADQLDADPYLLNVRNGTVDLRTGELRRHDPADHLSHVAGCDYLPGACSARWEAFLRDATGGDGDLAAFLQRCAGYTACGVTDEEVLVFAYGPGASGKTTALAALGAALGTYARTADFATFLTGRGDGDGPTPGVARLAGARMAAASEVAPGQRFNLARLKALTGSERIVARHLHRDPFEFTPAFTLWLAGNDRPAIPSEDDATWRRVRVLPFEHVVPVERRDPELKRRLTSDPDDLAAVLAWTVEGALVWQQHGLGTCPAVEQATAGYRAEGDPLGEWIATRCELAPDVLTPGGALRADYEDWTRESGDEPIGAAAFARALEARGLDRQRTRRGSDWRGIGLTTADPERGRVADRGRGSRVHVMRARTGGVSGEPATPATPATPEPTGATA
jgi:putative DNA primase/helicase